jgi:hypothetical protein
MTVLLLLVILPVLVVIMSVLLLVSLMLLSAVLTQTCVHSGTTNVTTSKFHSHASCS